MTPDQIRSTFRRTGDALLVFFTFLAPLKFGLPYTWNIEPTVPFLNFHPYYAPVTGGGVLVEGITRAFSAFGNAILNLLVFVMDLVLAMGLPAEWALLLLIITALCQLLGKSPGDSCRLEVSFQDVFWLLFVAAVWLSQMRAGPWNSGLLTALLFTGYALYFLLLRDALRRDACRARLLTAAVAACVAAVLFGFYQHCEAFAETAAFAGQAPEGTVSDSRVMGRLLNRKVFSTFVYSNSFAGYLVLWILLVPGLLANRSLRRPVFKGAALGALVFFGILAYLMRGSYAGHYLAALITWPFSMIYLLFLTQSKGGMLTLALVLAATAFMAIPYARKRGYLVAAFCAGVVILVLGWQAHIQTRLDLSARVRLEYWEAGWRMVRESPLTGLGPGSFGTHFTRLRPAGSIEEVQLAHNDFIQMAAEGGMLSLFAFCGIFAAALTGLFRSPLQPRLLQVSVAAAITAVLLHQGADFDWYVPSLGYTIVFLLSLTPPWNLGGRLKPLRIRAAGKAGLMLLLLLMAWPVTRVARSVILQERATGFALAGEFTRSEQDYREAIVAFPFREQPYVRLARLYQADERWEQAAQVLEDSLEVAPHNAILWYQLAWTLIQRESREDVPRSDRVLTALEKAIKYYPTHPDMRRLREEILQWNQEILPGSPGS